MGSEQDTNRYTYGAGTGKEVSSPEAPSSGKRPHSAARSGAGGAGAAAEASLKAATAAVAAGAAAAEAARAEALGAEGVAEAEAEAAAAEAWAAALEAEGEADAARGAARAAELKRLEAFDVAMTALRARGQVSRTAHVARREATAADWSSTVPCNGWPRGFTRRARSSTRQRMRGGGTCTQVTRDSFFSSMCIIWRLHGGLGWSQGSPLCTTRTVAMSTCLIRLSIGGCEAWASVHYRAKIFYVGGI
jgi:hypothetical protein